MHVDCVPISTQLDLDSCSHVFPDRRVVLMAMSDTHGSLSRVSVNSSMTSVMFRIAVKASIPHIPDSQTMLQHVQCMAMSTVIRNYGIDCCSCVVLLDHTILCLAGLVLSLRPCILYLEDRLDDRVDQMDIEFDYMEHIKVERHQLACAVIFWAIK